MPTFRHGKRSRVYVDGRELTTMLRETAVQQAVDTAETTAYQSDYKTFTLGMTSGRMTMSGMFSGGANDVDKVFNDIFGVEGTKIVHYCPDTTAIGSRAWGMAAMESSYQIAGSVGDIVAVSAEFLGNDPGESGLVLIDPFTTLIPASASSGNAATYDSAGSATHAGRVFVNVFGSTCPAAVSSLTFKVDSATATGGPWTTFVTADVVNPASSGVTATGKEFASTNINRYLRASWVYAPTGAAPAAVTAIMTLHRD